MMFDKYPLLMTFLYSFFTTLNALSAGHEKIHNVIATKSHKIRYAVLNSCLFLLNIERRINKFKICTDFDTLKLVGILE